MNLEKNSQINNLKKGKLSVTSPKFVNKKKLSNGLTVIYKR